VAFIPERLASEFIGVSRDFLSMPGTLKLLVWQALLPKLCVCAQPMRDAAQDDGSVATRLTALLSVYPGPAERLRIRNPSGCSLCREQQLPELFGYDGRSVAAEMIQPRLHPSLLQWVRQRGKGPLPEPSQSAMDHATAAAFQ